MDANINTLKDLLKKESGKSVGQKNASFYNKEKSNFIKRLSEHPDDVVRLAVASDPSCPAKTILAPMLEVEENEDVIKAIVTNPNVPKSAIEKFATSSKAKIFDGDIETLSIIEKRLKS